MKENEQSKSIDAHLDSKYQVLGYGKMSTKQLIKTMLRMSNQVDIIKGEYDLKFVKRDESKIKNIDVGVDLINNRNNNTKYIYFYINYFVKQSFWEDMEHFRYVAFGVDIDNPNNIETLGSISYLVNLRKKKMEIIYIETRPKYRNCGVGSQLHHALEDIAAKLKIRKITLQSVDYAMNFHYHNGFRFCKQNSKHMEIMPDMIKKKIYKQQKEIRCPLQILQNCELEKEE